MTAQVRVVARPWADSIDVYLMRDTAGTRLIERPGHINGPDALDPVTPGVDPGPSLTLTDETAVALLDALAAHYRRATDTGTLRADYENERHRVDRLTEALIGACQAALRPTYATGGIVKAGDVLTADHTNRFVR